MDALKKERISWYLYDFANSVFTTCVITVFLGPYITQIATNGADINGKISIVGLFNIAAGSYYPLIVAVSILLQVVILPFFSSLADNTPYKKQILFISAYIGAISTMLLFFVSGSNYELGGGLFIVGNICFGLSCVIYNSYLNHISTNETATKISSIGWAWGYFGGGILLFLNLLLYNNIEKIDMGFDSNMAVRICLASAGVWWGIFSLIPLKYLRKINVDTKINKDIISQGIKGFYYTIKDAWQTPYILFFLLAYTLYNVGIQSIIILAAQFGSEELGLTMDVLITSILLVQFIAVVGSLLFNIIARYLGSLIALKISLIIWCFAIIFAYFFLYTAMDFYFLCGVVGIVIGGTQAISRAIYSQLIPHKKEAEYFSLYELSEKGTSWIGPFIFAIVYNFTTSYRTAILSLLIFFILGFILLQFNKKLSYSISK